MQLDCDRLYDAAAIAEQESPLNRPSHQMLARVLPPGGPLTEFIAVLTTKYWRTTGVRLGVGFLDNPSSALRARILAHMNAWGQRANVRFIESTNDPVVRITRDQPGHWCYIGTDALLIDQDQPTMNLAGFTSNTPDREFCRVVRHQTGHALGCPHELMRAETIAQIHEQKAIAFFASTQGWTEAQVRAQILTPLPASSLWASISPGRQSIMTYQIPGAVTKSGVAIPGGLDIDQLDHEFLGKVYPQPAAMLGTASAGSDQVFPAAFPATHRHGRSCANCVEVG